MGKVKAHSEQGQAAQGWGLGEVGWEQEGSACPALLPLSLSVHRTCPQVELWGLNNILLRGINHSSAAWEAETSRASPETIENTSEMGK